jgi:LysM repeat protein/type II secretory pathway predicted ATPase ExeA
MYCTHFGLTDYPFRRSGEATIPRVGSSFTRAYEQIEDGIEAGIGLQLLVGPPGTGKTRLLACLESRLGDRYRVLRPNVTGFSVNDFLEKLADGLGAETRPGAPDEAAAALAEVLEREAAGPRGLLLVIDDAERLGPGTLESLPGLFSLGDAARPARGQIVLTFCPDFEEHLLDPGLDPLWASVDRTCRLEPLEDDEIGEYVLDALAAAGYRGEPVFAGDAIARIAERSGGVPRRIDNLCGVALLAAYENGVHRIGADLVDEGAATLLHEGADRHRARDGQEDDRPEAVGMDDRPTQPGAGAAAMSAGLRVSHHLIDWALGGLRTVHDGGRRMSEALGRSKGAGAGLRVRAAELSPSIVLGALVLVLVGAVIGLLPWPQEQPELATAPPSGPASEEQAPDVAAHVAALERELQHAARERRALRAAVEALAGSLEQVETRMKAAVSVSLARSDTASSEALTDAVPAVPAAGDPRLAAPGSMPAAPASVRAEDDPLAEPVPQAALATPVAEDAPVHPSGDAGTQPDTAASVPARPRLVVSKGDTLWSIAQRHGLSVAELARANHLSPSKPIYRGQRLKVPGTVPGRRRPKWYTVRRGDSLSSIGRRFDVPVGTLTRWNRLNPPDTLRPGQRLRVARADPRP